jgi:hypothetical protein
MNAKANLVRRSSPIDDLKYDFSYFSTVNVSSAVDVDTGSYSCENGHAAESELSDKMFSRTYAEHSYTRAVASPKEAVGHYRLKRGGTTPFLPLPSFPSPCPPSPFNGGPGVQPPEKIFKPQMLVDDF